MVFDLLITNGKIYDGSGNPWYRSEIGVKDGKIRKIGKIRNHAAKISIDASDLVISPGFIDIHSHSDRTLLVNGKAESSIRQGITTQLTGNCGSSPAPLIKGKEKLMLGKGELLEDIDINWLSFSEYLDKLQNSGVAINVAMNIGQGTLRLGVMGYEDRRPSKNELEIMKKLIAESMEGGAFGMSVGLNTYPSGYADTDELVELCKVVANYGGCYYPHGRGKWEDTVAETIEISERSGVSAHLVHNRPIIHEFEGDVGEVLKKMDAARERGLDITCDVYPYTWASSGLKGMLPPWVVEGGDEKIVERLKDPEIRKKVKESMLDPKWALNLGFIARKNTWDKVILLSNNVSEKYNGKTLLEIAGMMGVKPIDAVLDLMIAEDNDSSGLPTVQLVITTELLLMIFKHNFTMASSDSSALAPYGILGGKLVHPRNYGTYPRILGRWVREEKLITMEEAIKKMTSLPAQRLGLQDRGLLKEGMCADITIFDPKTIIDKATFENPLQYPEGIKYVIVNGQIVIKDGEHMGILPGKVLRHAF